MAKRREIRNSTAEFLIFQIEGKEQGIEVYYKDENIWATQKAMATLFDVNVPAISKHLKNIFESGELKDDAVVSKMEITASDGKRYQTQFYSLDAIIAVGYRVNSISCQLYPCHAVPSMGYERIARVCHSWLCARQETNGKWHIPR